MIDDKDKVTKFKAVNHKFRDGANCYMIANNKGALCGGNLRAFFKWEDINDFFIGETPMRYPAVFKSKTEAKRHMIADADYLESVMSDLISEIG